MPVAVESEICCGTLPKALAPSMRAHARHNRIMSANHASGKRHDFRYSRWPRVTPAGNYVTSSCRRATLHQSARRLFQPTFHALHFLLGNRFSNPAGKRVRAGPLHGERNGRVATTENKPDACTVALILKSRSFAGLTVPASLRSPMAGTTSFMSCALVPSGATRTFAPRVLILVSGPALDPASSRSSPTSSEG